MPYIFKQDGSVTASCRICKEYKNLYEDFPHTETETEELCYDITGGCIVCIKELTDRVKYPARCRTCNEAKNLYKDFPKTRWNGEVKRGENCFTCSKERSERVQNFQKNHSFVCECGVTLKSDTDYAIVRHEQTKQHKYNMKCRINGHKFTRDDLRDICSINKVPAYYNKSKEFMVDKLLEIGKDNIIYPEYIFIKYSITKIVTNEN